MATYYDESSTASRTRPLLGVLTHWLDTTLVSGFFSIGRVCVESVPAQLILLYVLLWITGIKIALTYTWRVFKTAVELLKGNKTLHSPGTAQVLLDDIKQSQLQKETGAQTRAPKAGNGVQNGGDTQPLFSFSPDDILKTPEERYSILPSRGYPFKPHYFKAHGVRVHYIDEAPAKNQPMRKRSDGHLETIVLTHGNPTWSYMYRYVVPLLVAEGFRVVALDFIGFGKSEKLGPESLITAELHLSTLMGLLRHIGTDQVTLVVHDWAGMWTMWGLSDIDQAAIGRLVLLNTALPPHPFLDEYSMENALTVAIWMCMTTIMGRHVPVAPIMRTLPHRITTPEALAYGVPYPSSKYKTSIIRSPRIGFLAIFDYPQLHWLRTTLPVRFLETAFPGLSDVLDNNARNMFRGQHARDWIKKNWQKPTLLLFGKADPLFGSLQHIWGKIFPTQALAYTKGRPIIVENAGHYLPDDDPERTAAEITYFVTQTSAM